MERAAFFDVVRSMARPSAGLLAIERRGTLATQTWWQRKDFPRLTGTETRRAQW